MTLRITTVALALFLFNACVHAKARKLDDYHWEGVERVIAVGDLHGDYQQYIKVLRSTGLINARGRWVGGNAHLVQTGDITDRGPSSRAIIDHLQELKKQAATKGGRVHTLIGNHEAMNSYGDLRYTHPGEFKAFSGPNSEQYREKQWEFQLQRIKQLKPEEFLLMNLEQYRLEWEKKIPLGWVEHRLAWAPEGEYGTWVSSNPVAIKINDTLFVHGGLSPDYCRYSLQEITQQVWGELQNFDSEDREGILEDEAGPLWYRGLAREDEETFATTLDQILEKYGASRIVVGHTPTGGVVWPRFKGAVVVNDIGIAAYYGSNNGYLELSGDTASAGYGDRKLELPGSDEERIAYLKEVIGFNPDNSALQDRLREMLAPPVARPAEAPVAGPAATPDAQQHETQGNETQGNETQGNEHLAAQARALDQAAVSPDICQ